MGYHIGMKSLRNPYFNADAIRITSYLKPTVEVRLSEGKLRWFASSAQLAADEASEHFILWESATLPDVREVIRRFILLLEKPDEDYRSFAQKYGCLGFAFRSYKRMKISCEADEVELPVTEVPVQVELVTEELSEWKRYVKILYHLTELHQQVLKNESLSPDSLVALYTACSKKGLKQYITYSMSSTGTYPEKVRKWSMSVQEVKNFTEIQKRSFVADAVSGLLRKLAYEPRFTYYGIAGQLDYELFDSSLHKLLENLPPLHGRLHFNWSYSAGLLDVLVSNFIADLCSFEGARTCKYPGCTQPLPLKSNKLYCDEHKPIAHAERNREQQRRWRAKMKCLKPE